MDIALYKEGFAQRLREAGIDPDRPLRYGAEPLIQHAQTEGLTLEPWLQSLENYVGVLHQSGIDLWAPLHFCVSDLAKLAQKDVGEFDSFLKTLSEILRLLEKQSLSEPLAQNSIRTAAPAFSSHPKIFGECLTLTLRLAEKGIDPRWILEKVLPALWKAHKGDASAFSRNMTHLEKALADMQAFRIQPSYPLSVGLAALTEQSFPIADPWESWLNRLIQMSRALSRTPAAVYSCFEYGLPGLKFMPSSGDVTTALDIGITLADHGIPPTPLFKTGFSTFEVAQSPDRLPFTFKPEFSLQTAFQITSTLAQEGIDPYFIHRAASPWLWRFKSSGPKKDPVERLIELARDIHQNGHSPRMTFELGIGAISQLEETWPGLFERAIELTENMAERGLDPGLMLAQGIPYALQQQEAYPWYLAEVLESGNILVDQKIDPEPLLAYALRPLRELAGEDIAKFRALRKSIEEFVVMLQKSGVDYRSVLFYDIQMLTQTETDRSEAFINLLQQLSSLLTLLTSRGMDPTPLLCRGLPAAGSVIKKDSWMFTEVIESCRRIVLKEGDPVPLLEQAIEPIAQTANGHQPVFQKLWNVLEQRRTELPEKFGPLVSAAAQIAGSDAVIFDQTLSLLIRLYPTLIEALPEQQMIRSLPAWSHLANSPASFETLLKHMLVEASELAPDERSLSAWLTYGLSAAKIVTPGRAAEANAFLHQFGVETRKLGARASHILRTAAAPVAEWAKQDSDAFFRMIAEINAIDLLLLQHKAEGGKSLDHFVEIAQLAARESPAFFPEALKLLAQVLDSEAGDPKIFLEGISYGRALLAKWPTAWSRLMAPTLRTQGRRAGRVIDLVERYTRNDPRGEDMDALREFITQYGVRVLDILENLLMPARAQNIITSLEQDRETIFTFVRQIGVWDLDLFRQFRQIDKNTKLSPSQKKSAMSALRDSFERLSKNIREGFISEEQQRQSLFGAALMYTFPPSTSWTRQQYEDLFLKTLDREEDETRLSLPPDIRKHPYALTRGSWQLREGAVPRAELWGPFIQAMEQTGALGAADEPPTVLGWDLLKHWIEGSIGRQGPKIGLLIRALRRFGSALPLMARGAETGGQLITLKESLSDGLRDQIEECLLACRLEDPLRYQRMVRDKLTPQRVIGSGLGKQIFKTLQSYKEGTVAAPDILKRLSGQLRGFVIDETIILNQLSAAATVRDLQAILEQLPQREIEIQEGIETQRLQADWVGQDVHAMQQELFGGESGQKALLEYREASSSIDMIFQVTKRRAHVCVGAAEGVCVAVDSQLWNNPEFFQTIFWDSQGTCRGGMHFLFVKENGERYLTLPGINPSTYLLDIVSPGIILDAALNYAWTVARASGAKGVWIPVEPNIHSNRFAIGTEILQRKWPEKKVSLHPFSYSPYSYSFSAVFDVPPPASLS
jgi:hypothetical protein